MKIPYQELSDEALNGVVDDYVLREGTDYGDFREGLDALTLSAKRLAVRRLLKNGDAEIWFDPETQSTTLRTSDDH